MYEYFICFWSKQPLRTAAVYWRVRKTNVSFTPDAFPTFIFYVTRGELEGRSATEWRASDNELAGGFYGLPSMEYDGLAKVLHEYSL